MVDKRFIPPPQKVILTQIGASKPVRARLRVLLCGPIQKDAEIQNWGAPCLGIIRIAEYIRAHIGAVAELLFYDPQIEKFDPLIEWEHEHIDILGVSLLHYTLFDSLVFIKQFKAQHPECLIVVGGNEAGANYQDIFDRAPVDISVTAEGEEAFADIIRWKLGDKKLEDIEGIIYRKYAKPITAAALWDYWKDVDFSRHRYPAYWQQIANLYTDPDYEKINYVRLMTVSHCQRRCTFCSLAGVRDSACGQRVKPAALSGAQIMELVEKVHVQLPDVRTIYFCTDDVFYPTREPFLDFMERYKKSGYNYRILIQTSTYSIKEEDFPKLKAINCQHITIGFENCSEAVRASLQKPQDAAKMEKIITWGKKYGIAIYILIILMPPESTLDDLKINYETISRWTAAGVQVSVEPVMYPYRGAPIFDTDYEFHYETENRAGVEYRDAKWIKPCDPAVREICLELLARREKFIDEYFEKLPHQHRFKGSTGVALISLLGRLLKERDPQYSYEGL